MTHLRHVYFVADGKLASDLEDDGYLLTFVYDASKDTTALAGAPQGTSELVIYSAFTMSDKPLARIKLSSNGARVPYGIHSTFMKAAEIPDLKSTVLGAPSDKKRKTGD